MIPIVIGVLGTVTKGLEDVKIWGWVETIQAIALLKSARILRRVLEILFRHPSQSSIAPGRSSSLHPVSAHSCCMLGLAGCPAFACPCEGVHWSTSLMCSSLLIQQCLACLVPLTWIVFVMGGKLPYIVWVMECFWISLTVIFSLFVCECVSWRFFCVYMCGSVAWNLLVTIFF